MSSSPRRIRTLNRRVDRAGRSVWRGVEAFGFWTAVLLPVAYPVVLVSDGWVSGSRIRLLGLLITHLVALVVGRGYQRGESRG